MPTAAWLVMSSWLYLQGGSCFFYGVSFAQEPPMIASAPDTLPRRGRGARAQTDGRRRGNRTAASDAGLHPFCACLTLMFNGRGWGFGMHS